MDVAAFHDLTRRDNTAPSEIGRQLGTTLDVIRHLLEKHPAPASPAAAQQFGRRAALNAAEEALSRSQFVDLYCRSAANTAGTRIRGGPRCAANEPDREKIRHPDSPTERGLPYPLTERVALMGTFRRSWRRDPGLRTTRKSPLVATADEFSGRG
ncbi:MAG: hypothetical protein WAW17_15070 [Rhodococcus sp. (in: high G+C Gram-positive bacteria)]|uniref:hypothetical protein n=1 Tax=Rhodococcus sp. TaxID=1831 RepID=UPI003BB16B47